MHMTPAQWAYREQQLLRVVPNIVKVLLGLAFLASSFSAVAATGEFDLGTVMTQYRDAAAGFSDIVRVAALKLAAGLFMLDLIWMILPRLLKDPDIMEIGVAVVMKVMYFSFITWLISTPAVPLSIVNGFIQLGKEGAHVTAVSPADVFWAGIDLINKMTTQFGDKASVFDVYPSLLLWGVNLIVLVVFAFMAAQFAVTWIQLWFFSAVSPIVLAFGMTKWTKDMAMKVITTPIVYGIKFLTLYFVLAGAQGVASFMGDGISQMSPTNLAPLWAVAGGSILLLILALKAPTMATDLLNGTSTMSAGDGVAAGLAAGGAIGAVAGGAVAMGGKLAGGVQSALGAAAGALGSGSPDGALGALGALGGLGGSGGTGGGSSVPGLGSSLAGAAAQSPASTAASFAPGGAQPAASSSLPAPTMTAAAASSVPAPVAPPASAAAAAPGPGPAAAGSAPNAAAPAAPAAPGVQAAPGAPAGPAAPAPATSSADTMRATPPAPNLAGATAQASAAASPAAPAAAPAAPGAPGAPAAPGAPGAPTNPAGSISAPAQPPAPGSKAAQVSQDAARAAINELKASDGGGASIQAHHGDE